MKADKTTDLEGSADCQPALRGDAHDEVALPAHQDILQVRSVGVFASAED